MIVILSIRANEASTSEVMKWIHALGGECVRINGQDLGELEWSLAVGSADAHRVLLSNQGVTIDLDEVKIVWFRKMSAYPTPDLSAIGDPQLSQQVLTYLSSEFVAFRDVLHHMLGHAQWLSEPAHADPCKVAVLRAACDVGLTVPQTLVTTSKDELVSFREKVGPIIIKPIGNTTILSHDGQHQMMYTETLDEAMIEALPERFFPILVQQAVPKRYELRVFYLDGQCDGMAILSQGDPQTRQDFRVYNFQKPNRMVPYALPPQIVERLRALMERLQQKTGSIDILRGQDGAYYFLEVNPVGQFGMVSSPCNYLLEKKVAQYLIEKDAS